MLLYPGLSWHPESVPFSVNLYPDYPDLTGTDFHSTLSSFLLLLFSVPFAVPSAEASVQSVSLPEQSAEASVQSAPSSVPLHVEQQQEGDPHKEYPGQHLPLYSIPEQPVEASVKLYQVLLLPYLNSLTPLSDPVLFWQNPVPVYRNFWQGYHVFLHYSRIFDYSASVPCHL